MTVTNIILAAAKLVKVPGALLLAICAHESADFTMHHNPNDAGTPSYGVCQVKEETAKMFGFKGDLALLNGPRISAKYAALYLKYQIGRYGDEDWCKITAAYNAGTYNESKRHPGKPRNLKYVKYVQKKLAEELQPKLSCKSSSLAEAK